MKRIGIINRGEAATRFQATVDALRREDPTAPDAVALYTDADADALFVRDADHAERIGEGRLAYMDVEAVLAAMKRSGCDAAWPGWGFASEDADFTAALEAAGITFIGPRPETMRALGDKIAAKQLAESLGVPVAPWAIVEGTDTLLAEGDRIGYPLLVKAAGAGGGRGIRRVDASDELIEAVKSATAEAERSFATKGVLLERCLDNARHIEVQIVGDGEGNVLVLGTRDCSLQRRRQKVIEECPAPGLPDAVRERLIAAARALGEATCYRSAGTVEFLYRPESEELAFLEVNTRLQVEHPVTEAVFGLDLCRVQIDVARGLPLPEAPAARGHAFEARVCAEDPTADFMPTPGVLARFQLPSGPGLRVDTGFTVGDAISADFDTLLAKVIAWGTTRAMAKARLSRALHQMRIVARGGRANLDFLRQLTDGDALELGNPDIGSIDRMTIEPSPNEGVAIIAAAVDRFVTFGDRGHDPDRHRVEAGAQLRVYRIGPEHFRVLAADGGAVTCHWVAQMQNQSWLTLAGTRYCIERAPGDTTYIVDGAPHRVAQATGGAVVSPSMALVLDVKVAPGDAVTAGQTVAVLESMKMEVRVEAPLGGVVREVRVIQGDQTRVGQVLLVVESAGDASAPVRTVEMPWQADADDSAASARRIAWTIVGWDAEPGQYAADLEALRPDDCLEVLRAFADIAELFERRPVRGEDRGRGGADAVKPSVSLETLRRQGPQALPESRRLRVERACGWHGITELAPKSSADKAQLRDVVLRLSRAGAQLGLSEPAVAKILTEISDVPIELLDRLSALEIKSLRMVVEAATRARYRIYEAPALEDLAERAEARATRLLAELEDGEAEWPALMRAPEALLGVLAPRAATGDPLAAEAFARRLEWSDPDFEVTQIKLPGAAVVWRVGPCHVWIGRPSAAASAIEALLATGPSPFERLDIILVPTAEDPVGELLEHAPTMLPIGPASAVPWRSVCVMSLDGDQQSSRSFDADGEARRDRRNIPPPTARRIDLGRLVHFEYERLTTQNDCTLFLAQAHSNPDDRRLLAYVEARSLRRRPGRPLHLPDVDRVFFEAARAMEAALEAHDPRRRMRWNRLTLEIRPVVPLGPDVVQAYVGRLAPRAAHLGLEKVIIRARFADASAPGGVGPLVDLSVSNLADSRPEFHVKPASHVPLQPRTPYESKVVTARRRGLIYPYELVSLLEKGSDLLPAGRFEEYDVEDGLLVSVGGRPRGQNTAGIIFGIMRAPMAHLPQGLCRVLILSDSTRRMGALAEPECVRVLAAIDLADRFDLPVEWIAVSAGARVDWETGTENLDWTARVLRRIVRFTQRGGEINVVVPGVCVGAQAYWNAEATMMMHTRGLLVMTSHGCMVLTGKRALDFSGCVSAEDDLALGGYTAIMGPNGQAQAYADDLAAALRLMHRYYGMTYVPAGERRVPRIETSDRDERDITLTPYPESLGHGFKTVGEILSAEHNRDRKRPFAARPLMKAVADADVEPVERWAAMRGAETAIVYETRIGGYAATLIGIDNQPVARLGQRAVGGPDTLAAGTLYPQAARKVARALNAASGRRPVVILANLSGFDGSPESLGAWQLEYGAEIGRSVVNFDGPILFVVVSRYHGGAYVVFSKQLNEQLEAVALEGSYASVIGGAPAAAVVFASETRRLAAARGGGPEAKAAVTAELAARFDGIHTVERARTVGSIDAIISPVILRPWIIERLRADLVAHSPRRAAPLQWDLQPSSTPPPIGDE